MDTARVMDTAKLKKKLLEQYREMREDGDFSLPGIWLRLVQSAYYGAFRPEEYGDMMSYRFIRFKHPELYETMFTKHDNAALLPLVNDEAALPVLRQKHRLLDMLDGAGRRYLHVPEHSDEEALAFLREGGDCRYILKANEGAGGDGISFLRVEGDRWEWERVENGWQPEEIAPDALLSELRAGDVLIEECIDQHDGLNRVFPGCIDTVFIHTALLPDGSAEVVGFPYLQFGCGDSRFSNSGNDIIVGIHDDGSLYPFGFLRTNWYRNPQKVERHPDTGVAFADVRVPYWEQALDLARESARKVPQLVYVKWDIAITPDGPALIEGNGMPGGYTHGQTYSMEARHHGVKEEMSEFLQALAFSKELAPERIDEVNRVVAGDWEDCDAADCDAVVVLGSTRAVSRIERAYEVFGQNPDVTYILCGGSPSEYPLDPNDPDGAKLSEAAFMRRYLLERGIPEDRIVVDDASTNTYENLRCAAKELERLSPSRVAIVSAWFHGRRVRELAVEAAALGIVPERVCFVPAYGKDTRPDNWFRSVYGIKALHHEWKGRERGERHG